MREYTLGHIDRHKNRSLMTKLLCECWIAIGISSNRLCMCRATHHSATENKSQWLQPPTIEEENHFSMWLRDGGVYFMKILVFCHANNCNTTVAIAISTFIQQQQRLRGLLLMHTIKWPCFFFTIFVYEQNSFLYEYQFKNYNFDVVCIFRIRQQLRELCRCRYY